MVTQGNTQRSTRCTIWPALTGAKRTLVLQISRISHQAKAKQYAVFSAKVTPVGNRGTMGLRTWAVRCG